MLPPERQILPPERQMLPQERRDMLPPERRDMLLPDRRDMLPPERRDFSPERRLMSPERPAMSPERQLLNPERPAFYPDRPISHPERPGFHPDRPMLRPDMPMDQNFPRHPFRHEERFGPNIRPSFPPNIRPNFERPMYYRPYNPSQFAPPMREIIPNNNVPQVTIRQPMPLPGREPEVRMLPVLPPNLPNLPPGGLAGKKVLINPHFKGNFQPPVDGKFNIRFKTNTDWCRVYRIKIKVSSVNLEYLPR